MTEEKHQFDVTIIGGGPAGISAWLWCADVGLDALLLEKEAEFGGQLLSIHNPIRNYLGVDVINGRELRDRFARQIENIKMKRITAANVVAADLVGRTLTLADWTRFSGRAVVIATGVRRRKLGVPGEDRFHERGILRSGVTAKEHVAGKTVVIVGGGDATLENALLLAETAKKVVVVHRRNKFSARTEFISAAENSKTIQFCFDSKIIEIAGESEVKSVKVKHLALNTMSHLATDAILIRIGVEPNTEMFRSQIDLDDTGYITIDANCATSLPGIYAVGDVANSIAPTIASAVGQGAIAAKAILKRLGL